MVARSNTADFIKKSTKIHGEQYDYSRVEYVNNRIPVEIICPIHGVFLQKPICHLIGHGCPNCGVDKKKGLIRGIAVNDTQLSKSEQSVKCWLDLLRRCFPKSEHEKRQCQSYLNVKFYEPWLKFSNFKLWFDENYIEGYVLDKDLLSNGIKMYSPSTCCFIPKELNNILQTERKSSRKIGCSRFFNKSKGIFEPKMCVNGRTTSLGKCYSETEAIELYKKEKKKLIDKTAKYYFAKGLISEKVYNSFLNYVVRYE